MNMNSVRKKVMIKNEIDIVLIPEKKVIYSLSESEYYY